MLIRAWDGETRPWSVGELRPHFPDSPGDPDGSGPPGPLLPTSRDNRQMPNHPQAPIHKPPRIRKRKASRKVAPSCRARLPDLGTVDIRSASPHRVKPLAYRAFALSVGVKKVIGRCRAEGYYGNELKARTRCRDLQEVSRPAIVAHEEAIKRRSIRDG